jgi:hypothetical protein
MALVDLEGGTAAGPPPRKAPVRSRVPRFAAEFEAEIRRLYVRMMDEPVPPRLLGILRAALPAKP